MKKILIVTLSLLASISSYAYDYYSEKDDSSTLYVFVLLIAGVLNVILLYKIWCMTNDVKKIREKFCLDTTFIKSKVRQLYLIGDIETAYNALNTYIVDEVENIYQRTLVIQISLEKEKKFTSGIAELVKRYENTYKVIGKEFPANIKDLTLEQYVNLAK
jgi:hypothetical protein